MTEAYSANGIITHLNISQGGVPKRPIPQAMIHKSGVEGDRQKNLKHHGGPDRAVCLWSAEIIADLQAEGHPISPGSTGENVTVSGMTWSDLKPGVVLSLGDQVQLEITDYAAPCRTIAKSFQRGRYGRISQKKNPGLSRLYARVLRTGMIQTGDRVIIDVHKP